MPNPFDTPIIIQKINESTEDWDDLFSVHARINKAKADNEYLKAGAVQSKASLTFEIRWFSDVKKISLDTQSYRILYDGVAFNIIDYDDFMMKHKTVKLVGVSY